MDSVPVVCLTGQVPTHLIGNDAFQEADTTGITRPCTKHNYLVKDVDDLARVMHEAFYIAQERPAGPGGHRSAEGRAVRARPLHRAGGHPAQELPAADSSRTRRASREAVALIAEAKRPLFYGGGGLINSGPEACARFAELVRLDRLALHADADGARRLAGERPAFPRHGRHARHLRGQQRDARLRCDDRGRLALRRPGDRAAQRVLAAFEEDPHRHRPVLDQQERAGRRADHRRLRRGAGGAARGLAKATPKRPTARRARSGGADRGMARARLPALRPRPHRTSSSRNTRWSGSMR